MKKTTPKKPRSCGSCSACCVSLRINTAELKKPADVSCKNLAEQGGCTIYDERPEVCRNWQCGWLRIDSFKERLRPDKSNVLIRIEHDNAHYLVLQPIGSPVVNLTSTDILELIANHIQHGKRIDISVPGQQGYQSSVITLNDVINATHLRTEQTLKMAVMNAIQKASIAKTERIDLSWLD
ncbi:YkgJ family cysteine cluster protein [Pseudomonas protegens]|uniref:YkgJ family cysteine cluster protein n=1 Tax=Pseudomonas protegens TaxID=380021 RepID=UPI0012D72BE2|nr:YkgJ family cysteine cluster protein [Pseudomonas protegens]